MRNKNVSLLCATLIAAFIAVCNYAIFFAVQKMGILAPTTYQIVFPLSFIMSGSIGGYLHKKQGMAGSAIIGAIFLTLYVVFSMTDALWVIGFVILLICHVLFLLGYAIGDFTNYITNHLSLPAKKRGLDAAQKTRSAP